MTTAKPSSRKELTGTIGKLLPNRRSRIALVAIAGTAFAASASEATLLVAITLLGFRIAGEQVAAVNLPFNLPLDELSTTLLLGTAFAILIVRLIVIAANAAISARLAESVLVRWRSNVVDSYLRASWEKQQGEEEGHLQIVTQTYVASVSTVMSQLSSALTSGTSFMTFVVGAFLLSPWAALGLMAVGALLFAGVKPLTRFVKKMSERQRIEETEYARLLGEVVSMPQEVRVFGAGDSLFAALERRLLSVAGARRSQEIAQRMTPQIVQALGFATILAGLGVASRLALADSAAVGALVLLLIRSLNYAQTFQATYQSVVAAEPFMKGVLEAVDDYRGSEHTPGTLQLSKLGAIEFSGAHIGYAGAPVLGPIDLVILPGESVGVIGDSGSGKSTLAASLLGLLPPTKGMVSVAAGRVADIDPIIWSRAVGFVPQEPKLFDGTVAENIAFSRIGLTDDDILRAAEMASLGAEIKKWGGLDYSVGPRGSKLSGGQRQRVSIARTLAANPQMIVLDEPTSALDGDSEGSITAVLGQLRGHCTLVIVAHRMTTLASCDRVLLVKDGNITELGTGQEIQTKDSLRLIVEAALSENKPV